MLFVLKKILTALITIPGVIIVFLLGTGIIGVLRRGRMWYANIIAGVVIYAISIAPLANFFMSSIEQSAVYRNERVDVMVVLGGGLSEGVADFSGMHLPSPDMMMRLVDAVRIYRKTEKPLIVSGGVVGSGVSEASVARRVLIDLGVDAKDIILEERSRDTVENARFVRAIFRARGFRKGLLITSAYHMRRSLCIFAGEGLQVIPHAAGVLGEKKKYLDTFEFLPNIHDLRKSAIALKEALGCAFYTGKYELTRDK